MSFLTIVTHPNPDKKSLICFSAALISLVSLPGFVSEQMFRSASQTFNACDFCLAAQGISPHEVGSMRMRIDVRYFSVGSTYQDGSKTANAGRELETHLTQQYTFFYALSYRYSLEAPVPVPRMHSEQLTEEGPLPSETSLGSETLHSSHDPNFSKITKLNPRASLPSREV